MVKINLSSWGVDVDTHTNKNNKFSMLTPSSQGLGLDIETQQSTINSDYKYREDPQNAIDAEIQRQKTQARMFFRQKKAASANLGFKNENLQSLEERYKEKSFNNLYHVLKSQLKNEDFNQKIDRYFKLTGQEELDMNMKLMADALERVGVLLPNEKLKMEEAIRKASPIIITFDFAIKVASDPDTRSWANYFLDKVGDAATATGVGYVGTQIYKGGQTAAEYWRILKYNLQRIYNANKVPDKPPGETEQGTGNQQQQGGPPGGGGNAGGAQQQQQGGTGYENQGQGATQGGIMGGMQQGPQQQGGPQQGGPQQGGVGPGQGQVIVHQPDQNPQPQDPTTATLNPQELPDAEHPIYAAIASLLLNRFTLIGLGAVITTSTLMAAMPQQFRGIVVGIVQENRPPMIMIRELISQGGTAVMQAYRNSIYGDRGPLTTVGPEVIRELMQEGQIRPEQIQHEAEPTLLHDETNQYARRIIDIVNHILTIPSAINSHVIEDFSQIKSSVVALSRRHRESGMGNLIDMALEALQRKGPGYKDSVEFCKEFLQILMDNLPNEYPISKKDEIIKDFNKAIRVINEYKKDAIRKSEAQDERTRQRASTSSGSDMVGILLKTQLSRIRVLFRKNIEKNMIEYVNRIKQNNPNFPQSIQKAINLTDRTLTGMEWLMQYVVNLKNAGDIDENELDAIVKLYNENKP